MKTKTSFSRIKKTIAATMALFSAFGTSADVVSDARELMDGADFEAAEQILTAELDRAPKSSQAGMLNQLLGECRFELGDYAGARKRFDTAKAKGVADAYRYLGRLAYLDYDFPMASELYAKYRQMKNRAKKPIAPEAEEEENRISAAEGFLDRVEKIAVIDSIAVDFEDFHKAYRLPASAGRLADPEAIPAEESRQPASMAFFNEAGDFAMWAEPDTIGTQRIYESIRLTDGTWHKPMLTGDGLLEGDSDYPFMMADGLTLYFANDGPESIGGYDIFVASRDAATGEYLQPQNMGMPYNSPYDDFMLAIDELNGVGWWATDRNRLDGKVTVYVFKTNDLRKNCNPHEDDVMALARIDRIADTQGNEDFSEIRAALAEIDPNAKVKKADFRFPMGKGRVCTSLDDFKTEAGREAMKRYLEAKKKYDHDEKALKKLRRDYADNPAERLASQIIQAEKALETDLGRLRRLRSDVFRAEAR